MNKIMKISLVSVIFIGMGAAIAAPAPVEDLTNVSGDRVGRLERMMSAKQQADFEMQNQVNNLQQDVQDLRGLVEQQNYQINQMVERQRQLYDEIAQLTAKTSAVSVTPAVNSQDVAQINPINSSLEETASYEEAVNLVLRKRQYDAAIPAFKAFIKQYPNSSYAANANYWLGQLLYNKNDFSEAKAAFNVVVKRYKDSNKRADSLVKLGLIAEKNGDAKQAKSYYKQVVTEYTNSSAARIAGQQLAGIKA